MGEFRCVKQVNRFWRIEETIEGLEKPHIVCILPNEADAKLITAAVNACPQLKAPRDKILQEQMERAKKNKEKQHRQPAVPEHRTANTSE